MKLKELVTADDNATLEISYIMGIIAFLLGCFLIVYCTVQRQPFNLFEYGSGMGALITLISAGKKINSSGQLPPLNPPQNNQ